MTISRRQRRATLAALGLCAALGAGPAWPSELAEIQALADKGRTEKALRRLDKMLDRDPELVEGRLLKGVLLVELGRAPAAEQAFRDLAEQAPERPEPVNNLAVLQAAAGRTEGALAALEEIVGRYPDYDAAAANLETLRASRAGEGAGTATAGEARPRLILTAELGAFAPAAPRAAAAPAQTPPLAPPAAPTAAHPEEAAAPVVAAPRPPANEPPAEPAAEPAAPEPVPTPEPTPEPVPAAAPQSAPMPDPKPAPQTAPVPEPAPQAAPRPLPETAPTPSAADEAGAAEADLRGELQDVVEAWAAAWSEQRVREYLAFYAADFEPTGYPSRQAWEATRRQRVAAPSFIEVEIDLESMTVRETGSGTASATFVQRYRSDRFGDTVSKTLDLVREAGAWRIRRETSG